MRHEERSGLQAWMCGLACGAGAMYFLDPARGRRRRALIRDKTYSFFHRSGDAVDATARNLRDEASGLAARMRSRIRREPDTPDEVLVARVRSEMGRVVSHPHAITVSAENGHVTMSGPILRDEAARLLSCARSVRGVAEVRDNLEPHDASEQVPALQGGPRSTGARNPLLQNNWSPALRAMVGVGGIALATAGRSRGGLTGALSTIAGGSLLARAVTNLDARRLTGAGAGARAVDIRKTFHINAPVEEVFAFWENVENFPRFMSHLREVRRRGDGRSHWCASGPGGISFEWDAVVTRHEPNRVLAWRSEPGAWVQNAGIVHFAPDPNGGSRIDIQMSYNPPGGAIGHAFASLFGADPKHAMDDDLVRFKSLIEHNKATAHGRAVYRDELEPVRTTV